MRGKACEFWREVGATCEEAMQDKDYLRAMCEHYGAKFNGKNVPKTLVYQDAAISLASNFNTVRQYYGYRKNYPSAIDSYPQMTIEQLRLAIKQARRDFGNATDDGVITIIESRIEQSFDGFEICPPSVWGAELKDKGEKTPPDERALTSACQNVHTLIKHWRADWPDKALERVQSIAVELDAMVEELCK